MSDFARRARLNRNTIHAYLRGKPVFSRQFIRIAEALGQDPFTLLGKSPDSVSKPALPAGIDSIVAEIVRAAKGTCVMLLGSRAAARHHAFSDWDLGVCSARGRLGASLYLRLKNLVDERAENLPWNIDLVNLDDAPGWFVGAIEHPPLLLGGSTLACARFHSRWEAEREHAKT